MECLKADLRLKSRILKHSQLHADENDKSREKATRNLRDKACISRCLIPNWPADPYS